MIRVLVVDDEPQVCRHLSTILDSAADLDVVGRAHDAAGAVEVARATLPDVVLLDLRMPQGSGLDALPRLIAGVAPPRVVVLTGYPDDRAVLAAMGAGAAGFLLKSTAPRDLVDLVRVAAAGHQVLAPRATAGLLAALGADASPPPPPSHAALETLTPRETDVLRALATGASNGRIARDLGLTESTVKGYVSTVIGKLGCESRLQAGLLAQRHGLQ